MAKTVIISFFLFFMANFSIAQEEWKLEMEERNIKVYSKSVAGSNFKKFRATTIANVGHNAVAGQLQDVNSHPDVFGSVEKAELKEGSTKMRYKIFSKLDLPWPLTNRCMLLDNLIALENDTNKIIINIGCIDGSQYVSDGYMEVADCSGQWILESLAENKSKLEYEFFLDLGGNAPAGLVNRIFPNEHMKTLDAVIRRASHPEYANFVLE